MARKSMFGHKMQKKSWDASEFNQEKELRKVGLVFLGLIVFLY